MNKSNAKDYLPLVQALAEGRTIQAGNDNYGWADIRDDEECAFCLSPCSYRIKPEPREIWVNHYTSASYVYDTELEARKRSAHDVVPRRYREVLE